jgi:DNA-binding XRE family transcriptional regulator
MKLARLRRRAGMSQPELAEKAGVSVWTVRAIESRGAAPKVETLRKLAKALRQPLASML